MQVALYFWLDSVVRAVPGPQNWDPETSPTISDTSAVLRFLQFGTLFRDSKLGPPETSPTISDT
eukprot:SAG31_NODE_29072_length_401_cov_0.850993_1_plen_63_part_10